MTTESIFLRDDIHQLAQNCIKLRYNHERRKACSLSVDSQRKYTQVADSGSVEKGKTTPRKKDRDWVRKRKPHVTDGFQGLKKGKDNYVSAGNFTQFSTTIAAEAKTQTQKPLNQHLKTFQDQTEPKPLFKSILRKISKRSRADLKKETISKRPLEPKSQSTAHMLYWLNEVLLENSKERFDTSIHLSAVKKYLIDRGSLMARGVPEVHIDRIYQSLYVYSAGFSQFLKNIQGMSESIYISLWKVYSILLQSFSGGSLDTIISNLIQQKEDLVRDYEEQLDRKQEQIDRNQEINKHKNEQIYKEYTLMKEQTMQLALEKELITGDFMEAEKSFSDEIGLRLLFQSKIGSLHYVYRQLMQKHSVIFKDLKRTTAQLQNTKKQLANRENQVIQLKQQKITHTAEIRELKLQVSGLEKDLATHREVYHRESSTALNWNIYRNQLINQNAQLKHNSQHLAQQLQSLKQMHQTTTQSLQALRKDYYSCLEANHRQLRTIEEQNRVNSRYLDAKRDKLQEQYEIQLAMMALKIEERDEKIEQSKIRYGELEETLLQSQNEKDKLKEQIERLESQLKTAKNTIQIFKMAEQHNSQMLIDKETHLQNYLSLLTQKQTANHALSQQISALQQKLTKCHQEHYKLKSEYTLLNEALQAAKTKHASKQMSIGQQIDSCKNQIKILTEKLSQSQKMMLSYRESSINSGYQYHNEQFQRKNLFINYQNALAVIESNAEVMKELKTVIVKHEQNFEMEERKVKIQGRKLDNERKQLERDRNNMTKYIEDLESAVKRKKQFEHPMLVEDLSALCIRQKQKLDNIEQYIIRRNIQFVQNQKKYKKEIKVKQSQIASLKETIEKIRAQNELYLQYQRQKYQQLNQQLALQQQECMKYKLREKATQKLLTEKQQKFIDLLKQKQLQIGQLMTQTQKTQDLYYSLLESSREEKIKYEAKLQTLERNNQSALSKLKEQMKNSENVQYFHVDEKQMKKLIRQSSKNESIYTLSNRLEQSRSNSKLTRKKGNSSMFEEQGQTSKLVQSKQNKNIKVEEEENKSQKLEDEEFRSVELNQEDIEEVENSEEQSLFDQPIWRKDLGNKLKLSMNYYHSKI